MENGYHPIFSIFQLISLFDTITIEKTNSKKLNLTSNVPELQQKNILHQVYDYFEQELSCGFNIHIQKRIPLGSGMGGGSSNAATFLNVLHHQYKISKEKIHLCAKTLGSDISFFLENTIAKVSGFGEITESLHPINYPSFLLISPNITSNTQKIYNTFDQINKYRISEKKIEDQLAIKHIGPNDLKESVWASNNEYQNIENTIKKLNIGTLHLSGSGATLFIPLTTNENIKEKKSALSKCLPSCNIIEVYAIKNHPFNSKFS